VTTTATKTNVNPSSHPESKTRINEKAKTAFSVQEYGGRTAIDGVQIVELKRFNDDGGAITELGRLDAGVHKQLAGFTCKQVNYSEVEPEAVKAYHDELQKLGLPPRRSLADDLVLTAPELSYAR
jgi:dTDP-4-dehydrorhamnose 3,5-epimerase